MKPCNQDLKAAPAWMISSRKIESHSEAIHSFVFRRAAANSAAVKSPEILTGVAVGVFQRSDTSFDTSRVDSQSALSYFPFLKSCAAMVFAAMRQ